MLRALASKPGHWQLTGPSHGVPSRITPGRGTQLPTQLMRLRPFCPDSEKCAAYCRGWLFNRLRCSPKHNPTRASKSLGRGGCRRAVLPKGPFPSRAACKDKFTRKWGASRTFFGKAFLPTENTPNGIRPGSSADAEPAQRLRAWSTTGRAVPSTGNCNCHCSCWWPGPGDVLHASGGNGARRCSLDVPTGLCRDNAAQTGPSDRPIPGTPLAH